MERQQRGTHPSLQADTSGGFSKANVSWQRRAGAIGGGTEASEGIYQGRTDAGLKPRFIKAAPPSNADISGVLQKISHRVIRKLRRLGYLEGAIDVPVATGYDPLLDNEPQLARSMAASVRLWAALEQRHSIKSRIYFI